MPEPISQDKLRLLLSEAVNTLCQTAVLYNKHLMVEGLIGITVDEDKVILVNIKEVFQQKDVPISSIEHHSHKKTSDDTTSAEEKLSSDNELLEYFNENRQLKRRKRTNLRTKVSKDLFPAEVDISSVKQELFDSDDEEEIKILKEDEAAIVENDNHKLGEENINYGEEDSVSSYNNLSMQHSFSGNHPTSFLDVPADSNWFSAASTSQVIF